MRHPPRGLFVLLAAIMLMPVTSQASRAEPAETVREPPIVVELYTSQGCYSCPPADRLLTRLAGSESWGERIIPLAFHVDYWNYIGWTDPFSSAAWTRRQERYANRVFRSNRIYTPQAVVGGEIDCTGSDAACIRDAVDRALARPPQWRVELAAELSREGEILVRVSAVAIGDEAVGGGSGGVGGSGAEEPEVFVALYENDLVTPVERGENAHRTLENHFVVRRLARAPSPAAVAARPLTFAPEGDWDLAHLGVVTFLQEPRSLRIVGAARLSPDAGWHRRPADDHNARVSPP